MGVIMAIGSIFYHLIKKKVCIDCLISFQPKVIRELVITSTYEEDPTIRYGGAYLMNLMKL